MKQYIDDLDGLFVPEPAYFLRYFYFNTCLQVGLSWL